MITTSVITTILSNIAIFSVFSFSTYHNVVSDRRIAILLSVRGNFAFPRLTVGAGLDVVIIPSRGKAYYGLTGEVGNVPISLFKRHRGVGGGVTFGVIFGLRHPDDMSGWSVTAYFPGVFITALRKGLWKRGLFRNIDDTIWYSMVQLAHKKLNYKFWRHFAVGFGLSTSGVTFLTIGLRTYTFGTFAGYTAKFNEIPLDKLNVFKRIYGEIFDYFSSYQIKTFKDLYNNFDTISNLLLASI